MSQSLVFVDTRVSSYQSLIDSLPPGLKIFVLDSAADGLAQRLTGGKTALALTLGAAQRENALFYLNFNKCHPAGIARLN